MSVLENQVKPLLLPLMANVRLVNELNDDERIIVARWAAKTVYCLNISANFPIKVPLDHLCFLPRNSNNLPQQVIVVGQHHRGPPGFGWTQSSTWLIRATCKDSTDRGRKIADSGAYKVTLQLGKLILAVAHWPRDDWRFTLYAGIHIPLWPLRGPVGWGASHQPFPWYAPLEAEQFFHLGIGIAEEGSLIDQPGPLVNP